jgi:hypothetical protein
VVLAQIALLEVLVETEQQTLVEEEAEVLIFQELEALEVVVQV